MSNGFYYRQEVTMEMINDIAKDLGNTSFNGFTTNKFGAGELNNITKSLVTKGVLTSGNACVPIVTNNKLYIQSGTIVFDNGAKKVLATSEEVEYLNNSVVYALNNVSAGTCSLVVANSFPETGDYVKLATVDGGGNVTDVREIATSKMALYGGNNEVIKEWSADVGYYPWKELSSFIKKDWHTHKYIMYKVWNHSFHVDTTQNIVFDRTYYTGYDYANDFLIKFVEENNYIKMYGRFQEQPSREGTQNMSGTFILI